MEIFSMRLTQTKGKHQLATRVTPLPQIQKTIPSENPLQDSDHGGCGLPKRLDSRLGLPHVVPKVQETTHSAMKIS